MVDLETMSEKTKKIIRLFGGDVRATQTAGQVLELITRLREAEKDAARYRWLRESASTEDHGGFAYSFRVVDAIRYMHGAAPNETMDIDDAIDEAMQCK